MATAGHWKTNVKVFQARLSSIIVFQNFNLFERLDGRFLPGLFQPVTMYTW